MSEIPLHFTWSTDPPTSQGFYILSRSAIVGDDDMHKMECFSVFSTGDGTLCIETDDGCWIPLAHVSETLGLKYWSPRLAIHARPPESSHG